MVKKVILGALLGGLAYFIWGAVAHMATPLGSTGFSTMPVDKEPAALAAMKAAAPRAGLYHFPGFDHGKALSESERRAWEAKLKEGPMGMLIITPEGGEAMTPGQLVTQLGISVLVALLASVLLAVTRLSYAGRVGLVVLLGLFAFVSIHLRYWNWYRFPTDFTVAAGLEEVLGGLVLGLVLAAIVKPKPAAG